MSLVRKFLAIERWKALREALASEQRVDCQPETRHPAVLIALLLALAPVLLTYIDALSSDSQSPLPTIAFGVCAVLSLLFRRRLGLPFINLSGWWRALSLTHTAVALGCIPAVLLLAFAPELLAERHDLLVETMRSTQDTQFSSLDIAAAVTGALCIAVWVALTEELIFRGLLVSVVRRWRILPKQGQRDLLAAILSALLFGIAHYATWGLIPSLALVGLGIGFVIGYIAAGERLLPVIVYHFVFDLLSILVSLLA